MPVPAREYHERTKHTPEGVRREAHRLDWENKPTPYKVYEDRPSVPLPEADGPDLPALRAIASSAVGTEAAPGREEVATLFERALGITKTLEVGGREHAFRAAACTGALYHVDGYLVAGDLAGLDAGIYHFDHRGPALDVLREGDVRGNLAAATGGHPAVVEAPITMALTSTWWRNAWKYRERTYRHAFWDSGTVVANLLATATGLELPTAVVTGFADGPVAELLGVDPATEGPVALLPVGAGARAPEPAVVDPLEPETAPLSPDPVEYDLITEAYAGSSLPDGRAASGWREAELGGVATRGVGDGSVVALDPVDDERAAKTPLPLAVRRRGSAREYAREALSFRKVSTVLDRATRGVPMDATGTAPVPLALNDCYLLVNGVEDVEPGVYQFHPAEGVLERLHAGECRREAGHLALDQRLAADAALTAFFMTDLDGVVAALGDRGYRAAQLEAAVTAGRLYLAAYAHRDLGATGLTFYDDEVTGFLPPRAAGQTPTFCWTLGRPT